MLCRATTQREPVEHIVPEGLVGHQPFQVSFGSIIAEPRKYLVLDHDEVCRRCPTNLADLTTISRINSGFCALTGTL